MKTLNVKLASVSPYSQSKHYDVEKANNGKECMKNYEARTWRERLHVDNDGYVIIPPMAFKNVLSDAAKFLSLQIKGKGKSTYTKHFVAGVLVVEPLKLHVKKESVLAEWCFVPSDGVRGSGKRVEKCFPFIPEWKGEVTFLIFDETLMDICKDEKGREMTVFEYHLIMAGRFIGIGRFRPINNGFYGRFEVVSVQEV